jgi:hypothetical protein
LRPNNPAKAFGSGYITLIYTTDTCIYFEEKNTKILEIGIYSGGSLEMWYDYF